MRALETEIHAKIPMVKAMGVQLKHVDAKSCRIWVPLKPNINHKSTAFGGSLFASCTAACYGLLYFLQKQHGLTDWDLVIAQGQIQYKQPTTENFFVDATISEFEPTKIRQRLLNAEKVRLLLTCQVFNESHLEEPTCHWTGKFTFLPQMP